MAHETKSYATLATGLSRVLFPIVIVLGLTGIVVGILNSYDHFTVPALAPVAWNLVILLGLGPRSRELGCHVDAALLLRGRDPRRDHRPVPAAVRRGCVAWTTGCTW